MPSEKIRQLERVWEDPIPELLHALCQPLTSLRCALETTLAERRGSEEYRSSLRESLGLAEEISELAAGLRELLEVEKTDPPAGTVDLDDLLREMATDLLPLANSRNSRLVLKCESCLQVKGERQPLTRAILYLLSFVLDSGQDATIRIDAATAGLQARIGILIPSAKPGNAFWPAKAAKGNQAARSCLKFLIARAIFERMGGSLWIVEDAEQVTLRGSLVALRHSGFHARKAGRQGRH